MQKKKAHTRYVLIVHFLVSDHIQDDIGGFLYGFIGHVDYRASDSLNDPIEILDLFFNPFDIGVNGLVVQPEGYQSLTSDLIQFIRCYSKAEAFLLRNKE